MYEIEYVTGTGGRTIGLDGDDLFAGLALALHGSEWSYELGYRSIGSTSRKARSVDVDITSVMDASMDEFRRLADRDVALRTPGTIVYRDGLSQRCYLVKSDPSGAVGRFKSVKFTCVLLDGAWSRPVTTSFTVQAATSGVDLDFEFDYEHDLMATALVSAISSGSTLSSPMSLTIYGPASSPYVVIDDNKYVIDVTVPAGGYLVVDGREGVKSVTLVAENGDVTDCFSAAHRGSGQNGGEYAFQPIAPGRHTVSWPNSFGFDITIYEQEAALPWSQ
jgi:hypothetical protein